MASPLHPRSAEIIAFPAGGRAALRERGWSGAKADERVTMPPRIVFDGWYHEEAVRDEQERREH